MITALSKYLKEDNEKRVLIDSLLNQSDSFSSDFKGLLCSPRHRLDEMVCYDADFCSIGENLTKFCPKCHRKYPEEENFCFECLVALKPLTEKIPVIDIKTKPVFKFKGKNNFNDFKSILTEKNLKSINEFKLNISDYNKIIKNIKTTSLKNLDKLIKDNCIDLDELSVFEHVLLFTKSFVKVGFKSYGHELGYFEFDKIVIDDRQNNTLLITTLIHELSHFILKEILTQILCTLLDCSKNIKIECIIDYILIYSNFTRLIDEYSAHCCEGRFTVYGYQDYSSFLNIVAQLDGEMSKDEIEITKSIGNTFANSIKDILESVINRDLLNQIKQDFEMYHIEKPNYEMLKLENCEVLTSEGFLKAIWLILSEGFENALNNMEKVEEYYKEVI